MINIFQPALGTDELAAVSEVFESGWVGKGQRTVDFYAAFATHRCLPSHHSGREADVEVIFNGFRDAVMLLSGVGES